MKYQIESKSDLPHQQRVIDEAKELSIKLNALDVFIDTNPIFMGLDEKEQKRLLRQVTFMELYWGVLAERINNF